MAKQIHVVLLVPDLAYNLFSVTSAPKRGNVTTFSKLECEIKNAKSNLLAVGGSLYYLHIFLTLTFTKDTLKLASQTGHREF